MYIFVSFYVCKLHSNLNSCFHPTLLTQITASGELQHGTQLCFKLRNVGSTISCLVSRFCGEILKVNVKYQFVFFLYRPLFSMYFLSGTSNNGHCRGISILSVIGSVR
jgi:hypothetical protein